jgi:ribosome recycling factor
VPRKPSPTRDKFERKGEELIVAIRKVRRATDEDALKNLKAAEDLLKEMTEEAMKTKTGPKFEATKWDVEMPD